jgi:hypothetical protein
MSGVNPALALSVGNVLGEMSPLFTASLTLIVPLPAESAENCICKEMFWYAASWTADGVWPGMPTRVAVAPFKVHVGAGAPDGDVEGDVDGDVEGDVDGDVEGDADGDVEGDVDGDVEGDDDAEDEAETFTAGVLLLLLEQPATSAIAMRPVAPYWMVLDKGVPPRYCA